MENLILNNNIKMPQLGIGTYLLEPADAYNSVLNALKMGYRLIDTANAYMNERSVGRAIKDSKINRDEIFVSTKIWASEYENENAVEETLERLGLDYIDLLFIHQPTKNWRVGYEMLVKAYKAGKIRSIGISNFEGEYINDLLKEFDVIPQVIQVECHPFYPQTDLRKIIDNRDIKLMSWYPLGGKGMTKDLLENSVILDLAKKYHKTAAQIILKWHVEMGFIVIPGSKNIDHIKDNIDIFDFSLTKDDMTEISTLNNGQRRYNRTDEALERFMSWQPVYEAK